MNPRNAAAFLRGAFSLEKTSNLGAVVGRITYKFTVTLHARRVLLEKTQGMWKGAAARVFLEKRYGILGGWRECHVNLQ